ncbi:hypothetical protein G4B88_007895 [Cannabis sativa]|uniref:DUF4283 domain-containing protein n=1 Tax=Cannabis sativa TaxID=3483 RepID=A0A7J6EJZ2_CANSA|nr:hypothetical protein G4B88_007895 [Cannabis sativa]
MDKCYKQYGYLLTHKFHGKGRLTILNPPKPAANILGITVDISKSFDSLFLTTVLAISSHSKHDNYHHLMHFLGRSTLAILSLPNERPLDQPDSSSFSSDETPTVVCLLLSVFMELVNASLTTSPLRGRCLSVNEALIKLVPSESSRKALSTFCLLGKVVAPMTVSEANVVDFVAKAWKFPVTVVALSEGPASNNCFELSFAREEDRCWALDHGPWCIRGYSFFLQVWSPTNVSPVKSDMLRTWVQVHNMPHDYFSKANGHLLGGKAGSVIHVDLQEDNPPSWGKYLKVSKGKSISSKEKPQEVAAVTETHNAFQALNVEETAVSAVQRQAEDDKQRRLAVIATMTGFGFTRQAFPAHHLSLLIRQSRAISQDSVYERNHVLMPILCFKGFSFPFMAMDLNQDPLAGVAISVEGEPIPTVERSSMGQAKIEPSMVASQPEGTLETILKNEPISSQAIPPIGDIIPNTTPNTRASDDSLDRLVFPPKGTPPKSKRKGAKTFPSLSMKRVRSSVPDLGATRIVVSESPTLQQLLGRTISTPASADPPYPVVKVKVLSLGFSIPRRPSILRHKYLTKAGESSTILKKCNERESINLEKRATHLSSIKIAEIVEGVRQPSSSGPMLDLTVVSQNFIPSVGKVIAPYAAKILDSMSLSVNELTLKKWAVSSNLHAKVQSLTIKNGALRAKVEQIETLAAYSSQKIHEDWKAKQAVEEEKWDAIYWKMYLDHKAKTEQEVKGTIH